MTALGASQLQGYLFGKAVAASDIAHVTLVRLDDGLRERRRA